MEAVEIPVLAELSTKKQIFRQEIQLSDSPADIICTISEWLHLSNDRMAMKYGEATWKNLLSVLSNIGMDSIAKNVEEYLSSTGKLCS